MVRGKQHRCSRSWRRFIRFVSTRGRKMRCIQGVIVMGILISVIAQPARAKGDPKEAVVKIFTVYNEYDYDELPTYYIIGGLVFEPLTLNFLKTWKKWYLNAPSNLLNYYFRGEPTEDRREIVVLVKVLADEINVGYHDWKNNVIESVNGRKIASMRDLVDAFEQSGGAYHTLVDEEGYQLVLDKRKVDENHERILRTYRIGSDRSKNLQR